MTMGGKILCISAGQLVAKKTGGRVGRKNQYLNYGLLSLASVLKQSGADPVVLHGGFDMPETTLRIADQCGLAETNQPVLLSLPSFFAISWAKQFIALLRNAYPNQRVIVGGRWVINERPDLVHQALPGVDTVVDGLAEQKIVEIINQDRAALGAASYRALSELDYTLLHRRAEFQPSIEISRGCGMGCSFCQESKEKLLPLKRPADLVAELKQTLLRDQWGEMTPYFEASMFVPKGAWINELQNCLDASDLQVRWRAEARADLLDPDLIPGLAKTGLSVIDLGLESASPQQLLRMRKTHDPDRYLNRASALLHACAENGVKVKINILLYAGETLESVAQTMSWLEQHRECIYGVSAGPVFVYGWPDLADAQIRDLSTYGAKPFGSPCEGVTRVDLSDEISHEESLEIADAISRRFMSDRRYFDLKAFSYFPRSYSYQDFQRDMALDRNLQNEKEYA